MRARAPFFLIFLFIFSTSTAEAIGGRIETKRERMQKEQGGSWVASKRNEPGMRDIYEAYLKEDFPKAEGMCSSVLRTRKSVLEADELRYLDALCLLKMRRTDEARRVLGAITASASPFRPEAALSFADSFTVDGDTERAATEYRRVASEYADSDAAAYARSRLIPSANRAASDDAFFSVQVGSFSNADNARSLLGRLVETRYDAYLENGHADRLYRVRVGRFHSKAEAMALETRLKKDGYPTKFVSETAVS